MPQLRVAVYRLSHRAFFSDDSLAFNQVFDEGFSFRAVHQNARHLFITETAWRHPPKSFVVAQCGVGDSFVLRKYAVVAVFAITLFSHIVVICGV